MWRHIASLRFVTIIRSMSRKIDVWANMSLGEMPLKGKKESLIYTRLPAYTDISEPFKSALVTPAQ